MFLYALYKVEAHLAAGCRLESLAFLNRDVQLKVSYLAPE